MIERPSDSVFVLLIYALAAICGGMGGCASWAWYTSRHHGASRRFVYLTAYMIIGVVFGISSTALTMMYHWVATIEQLIFYSMASGVVGTITIFAVNWGAGVILRWRGIELRLTFRDKKQERRYTDVVNDD